MTVKEVNPNKFIVNLSDDECKAVMSLRHFYKCDMSELVRHFLAFEIRRVAAIVFSDTWKGG